RVAGCDHPRCASFSAHTFFPFFNCDDQRELKTFLFGITYHKCLWTRKGDGFNARRIWALLLRRRLGYKSWPLKVNSKSKERVDQRMFSKSADDHVRARRAKIGIADDHSAHLDAPVGE